MSLVPYAAGSVALPVLKAGAQALTYGRFAKIGLTELAKAAINPNSWVHQSAAGYIQRAYRRKQRFKAAKSKAVVVTPGRKMDVDPIPNIRRPPPPSAQFMREGIREVKQVQFYERYGLTSRTSNTRSHDTNIDTRFLHADFGVTATVTGNNYTASFNNLRCLNVNTAGGGTTSDIVYPMVVNILNWITEGTGEQQARKCSIDIKNLKIKMDFFNRHPQEFYIRISLLSMKSPLENDIGLANPALRSQYWLNDLFMHPDNPCEVLDLTSGYWWEASTHHQARLKARYNSMKYKVLHNKIIKVGCPSYDLTYGTLETTTIQDGPNPDKTIYRTRRHENHIKSHTINTGRFTMAWLNEGADGYRIQTPNMFLVAFVVDASKDRYMSLASGLPMDYYINYDLEFKDVL